MKVFVYGSLMRGGINHSVLEGPHTEFIATDITQRGFTLYDLGAFPGMVEEGNGAVVGEIYEVCPFILSRLDILEGHPQFYKRCSIKLQSGVEVQTYILPGHHVDGCPVIKSGSWKHR